MLFHITTRIAWEHAVAIGRYRAPSLDSEGFIHLSTGKQWLATANRFFRGQAGLVLLSIRKNRLHERVVDEPAEGELFPHLYGELNLDAVTGVFELSVALDGTIEVPAELEPK